MLTEMEAFKYVQGMRGSITFQNVEKVEVLIPGKGVATAASFVKAVEKLMPWNERTDSTIGTDTDMIDEEGNYVLF